MEKSTNIWWDVAVLWPFIYFFLVLGVMGGTGFLMAQNGQEGTGALFGLMALFFVLHMATMVLLLVTYIYAIHRLYTQTQLSDQDKKVWLILVVVLNVFAIPILHFKHLRK